VIVETATVRGRSLGAAIVSEARRRGVEAIVLAAEQPSRVRGGARLGGLGRPSDRFLGDMTKYVVEKAPCRVVLTAPAHSEEPDASADGSGPDSSRAPASADDADEGEDRGDGRGRDGAGVE
jgi:APA family basic amino acid/polyamine antiporter